MPREGSTLTLDPKFVEKVVKLRDTDGKKWDEISDILNVAPGKCMLAHAAGVLPKKELIKNPTAADVVRLRDEQNLSWGEIMVRTMLPEGACRALYSEATGKDTKGNRIGKGGRHPGEGEAKPAKSAKKAPKGGEAPAGPLAFFAEDAVKDMLTGYAIKFGDGTAMKVKSVKKVSKGKAIVVDADSGESRTIKLDSVAQISKRKVA